MKKKDKLLNYTLSVGFILLIVIFLTSIISISRYVLSDGNAIQEHVVTTKNLLEDIERVEKSVETQENTEIQTITTSKNKKIANYEKNIKQISYLNINENKSILTFTLNKEIKELNNINYIEYENQSFIEKNDVILYNVKEKGVILTNNQEELKVFNFESSETEEIEFGNILGKIIYENDIKN